MAGNTNDSDIKGGGNPFVDYDFYLHPEKNTSHSPVRRERSAKNQPARRSTQQGGQAQNAGKRPAQKKNARPSSAGGPPRRPAKPQKKSWLARTKSKIAVFYSTKRPLKIALTVLAAILLAIIIAAVAYLTGKLGLINSNADETDFVSPSGESDYDVALIDDELSGNSLKELLKDWAGKGDKLKSKNVVNILLLGMDSTSGNGGAGAHSDSIMIASVNKKTKVITLVSIFRDCYTYMNGDRERYCKLTEVNFWSGPKVLMETIENNYKIEINDYACVNFSTFPKVIDALGGVEIELTSAESKWLANKERVYVGSGRQTLNGQQALAYSRIRYLDSDIKRAERQRKVLFALLEKSKSASLSQLDDVLNSVLPNVGTSLSRSQIVSLATQALTGGWNKYQFKQMDSPGENAREGKYIGDKWYWVADYPLAAQDVQKALYGETNIVLHDGRKTALDFFGSSSTGSGGSASGGGANDVTSGKTNTRSSATEPTTNATQPTTTERTTEPAQTTTTTQRGGDDGEDALAGE